MTGLQRIVQHRMRAYYIPIAAGILLAVSSFLPWMFLGEVRLGGVRAEAGLWFLALGLVVVAAGFIHAVAGLVALAITFLGYQWLSRSVNEAAWARSQAKAIVENIPATPPEVAAAGIGLYLGMAAALVLVGFGLTIVVKQVPRPYATSEDDDI